MEREKISDQLAEEVVGGSIIFSKDHTTCGLNRNDQCKVLDFSAAIQFISDNKNTMSEKDMMRKMVSLGYIVRL